MGWKTDYDFEVFTAAIRSNCREIAYQVACREISTLKGGKRCRTKNSWAKE
jgi:hypothetical protein